LDGRQKGKRNAAKMSSTCRASRGTLKKKRIPSSIFPTKKKTFRATANSERSNISKGRRKVIEKRKKKKKRKNKKKRELAKEMREAIRWRLVKPSQEGCPMGKEYVNRRKNAGGGARITR